MAETGPIFIGGTGRSGTSVMAKLLNSHPRIVLPAHENKLIVEHNGLKSLVDLLSGAFDMKSRHYAVADFAQWARKLRHTGFNDAKLNDQVRGLMADTGLNLHAACEAVAREHPGAALSIHSIGAGFGLEHYDASIKALIGAITSHVVEDGIVDTEGLIRPFVIPKNLTREALIHECRRFLDRLYAAPLSRAGAGRWCDDTPSNWLYLAFLFELYPDMRFIHMIRDPRDVVGSYLNQVWAPSDPKVVVNLFKAQFAAYEQLIARTPKDRVMEIRMEDISQDKAAVMGKLSDFIGEENLFNADIFFNEKTNTGAYVSEIGPDVTSFIEAELSDWMTAHGYVN